MGKTACIILNYNDADTAAGLAAELRESTEIDEILLVDNCSSDDSWEKLTAFVSLAGGKILEEDSGSRAAAAGPAGREENPESRAAVAGPAGREERPESRAAAAGPAGREENPGSRPGITLFRTKKNGGYGYGNQAGINEAVRLWDPEYVIIANPDIHVTDRCIRKVKNALEETENGAAASAMVVSPGGERLFSYWDLLPFWRDLLDCGPICRRIFKPWLITPADRLPRGGAAGSRMAGAVPGSFFVLKMSAFPGIYRREIFDRKVFLYCEEKILAQKLKKRGLGVVLVTDAEYVHAHSASIDKSVAGLAAKQKILHRSRLYYYRRYLGAGPLRMLAARLFLAAVYAEVRLFETAVKFTDRTGRKQ